MPAVLILGASSAIAEGAARIWAAGGAEFFLVGRRPERLQALASDLVARGAGAATIHVADLQDVDCHARIVSGAIAQLNSIDVVLFAYGTLPSQPEAESDPELAIREFDTNARSVISLLTRLAIVLESQGSGRLAVITSVAGDRGRPSNYLYGSAKAAVSTFCEGLHARLARAGVSVTDIRPGFVDSPMTAHLSLPSLFVSDPRRLAQSVVQAIDRRRAAVYLPGYWRAIMIVVRMMPRALIAFARL